MAQGRAYHIREVLSGQTLPAALRGLRKEFSWAEAKKLIASRRVSINGNLCLDEGRRVKTGEVVHIFEHSKAAPPTEKDVRIVYIDSDLLVVEKPAGVTTLRHREEQNWPRRRKQKQQTLDELIQNMLPALLARHSPHFPTSPLPHRGRRNHQPPPASPSSRIPKVRPVHRLDRDTSGLMLFALSPRAEQELVKMFKAHAIERTYRAVVLGQLKEPRTIRTWLVRDRGDGLRGSLPVSDDKMPTRNIDDGEDDDERSDTPRLAITHIRPLEQVGSDYTIVECRLETGRTHQIRIHLSEIGHMLCGEKVYTRPMIGAAPIRDASNAPRHALHSASIEVTHPITGKSMRFTSNWPKDLALWLERLRKSVR